MLRAPHFLGVHTLVLDAEPLRLEALRVWVGAATRDGSRDGGDDEHDLASVMSGAAMGAHASIGSEVGGAYIRAQLDGDEGPPLHAWLGAQHANWQHRIGSYRLRILSVSHEEVPRNDANLPLDLAVRANAPRQLGAREETVIVTIALDRPQLPTTALDALLPLDHGASSSVGGPPLRAHLAGEELFLWLSTQFIESLTIVEKVGGSGAQASGEAVLEGERSAHNALDADATHVLGALGPAAGEAAVGCLGCPPPPSSLPPIFMGPSAGAGASGAAGAGGDSSAARAQEIAEGCAAQPSELTLTLHVRPASPAAPEDAGLFGAPPSHWRASLDLIALSASAEAHESINLTPGGVAAATKGAQPKLPDSSSAVSRRLRAQTAGAQPLRNGHNGLWSVGEYELRVVEVAGHFLAQGSPGGEPSPSADNAATAGSIFSSQYPILSLAVCVHVRHLAGQKERETDFSHGESTSPQSAARAKAKAMAMALEDLLL